MDEVFNQCLISNPFKFEAIPSIMFLAKRCSYINPGFYFKFWDETNSRYVSDYFVSFHAKGFFAEPQEINF